MGRFGILPLAVFFTVACASLGTSASGVRDPFIIMTPEGAISVTVNGSAGDFTNTDLARLIRESLAENYPIKCSTRLGDSTTVRQMVWNLGDWGRWPRATISVEILKDGKIIKSEFSIIAAPGINPDAVFMDDVSRLAHQVLSSSGKILVTSGTKPCPF